MKKPIQLFLPEFVPLENKGEEAIVRGIMDVLFPDGNCEIHLFDDVDEYRFDKGIHVYPVKWFISPWLNREFGIGFSWEKIRDSACSIIRNGLHKIYPDWVNQHCSNLKKTFSQMKKIVDGEGLDTEKGKCLRQILDCNYVIVGHDGALDERVCHIIEIMTDFGKKFGVFGVEFPPSFKSKSIVNIEHKALKKGQFFYCRTKASQDVVKKNFTGITSKVLYDPAFGMMPAKESEVLRFIEQTSLTEFFKKPVIMCTSCEPPPISRFCFEEQKNPSSKLSAHRDFFAELIRYIVDTYDANILFLPHAIGPGNALDDRIIARDILTRSGLPKTRACLLEESISAKLLKGLIKKGDFLVAERIHSMIGAASINTPFMCLGSNTDRRIEGIIKPLGNFNNIYYLNKPNLKATTKQFDELWLNRNEMRNELKNTCSDIKEKFEREASIMRERILSSISYK